MEYSAIGSYNRILVWGGGKKDVAGGRMGKEEQPEWREGGGV